MAIAMSKTPRIFGIVTAVSVPNEVFWPIISAHRTNKANPNPEHAPKKVIATKPGIKPSDDIAAGIDSIITYRRDGSPMLPVGCRPPDDDDPLDIWEPPE